jgi:hypothetical protein
MDFLARKGVRQQKVRRRRRSTRQKRNRKRKEAVDFVGVPWDVLRTIKTTSWRESHHVWWRFS